MFDSILIITVLHCDINKSLLIDMASLMCGICHSAPPKYKCPLCRIRYCSAVCYKTHKETPCQSTDTPAHSHESTTPTPLEEQEYKHIDQQDDENEHLLTKQQLQSISRSNNVKKALQDPQLRRTIQNVRVHIILTSNM